MTRRTRLGGFASRLFLAQALVIIAGASTLTVVVFAIAPGIFHSHVRRGAGPLPDTVSRHIDEAFSQAVLVALGLAITAALLAALGMSAVLATRLARPVRTINRASQSIAGGRYAVRVPVQGPAELAELAATFNQMAQTLESSEQRRRALLSDVAHELRTPLATLQGYIEGLADGAIPPEPRTWAVLSTEAKRMQRLVEDLSTVSRAEERQLDVEFIPASAGGITAAAAQAVLPRYTAKDVGLVVSVEPGLPEVLVDPERLTEVLLNLLDNALRHTPSGGSVAIEASRRGSRIEIAVTDTGQGIAPEHLERIFERFFRTDAARSRTTGGSGIGLTIARALVESMGGQISATSQGSGHGARFVVRLPYGRGRPGVQAPHQSRAGDATERVMPTSAQPHAHDPSASG